MEYEVGHTPPKPLAKDPIPFTIWLDIEDSLEWIKYFLKANLQKIDHLNTGF